MRSKLSKFFQIYESKFGDVRLRTHEPSSTIEGKNKMAWDDIYGDDDFDAERTSQPAAASWATSSAISELSSYLDSDTVNQFDDSFSILGWWHQHKLTYPILSILAKDVMTVPVEFYSIIRIYL